MHILIYVDDIIVISSSIVVTLTRISFLPHLLCGQGSWGPLNYFLGIGGCHHKLKGLLLTQ